MKKYLALATMLALISAPAAAFVNGETKEKISAQKEELSKQVGNIEQTAEGVFAKGAFGNNHLQFASSFTDPKLGLNVEFYIKSKPGNSYGDVYYKITYGNKVVGDINLEYEYYMPNGDGGDPHAGAALKAFINVPVKKNKKGALTYKTFEIEVLSFSKQDGFEPSKDIPADIKEHKAAN